jgi:putative ABC transport system permease protein
LRARFATRVALRQLTTQPHRVIGGIVGLAAAISLMMVQLGMRDALYESAVRLHRSLDADLVLTSRYFVALTNMPRFPQSSLYRAEATPGVASARPLYVDALPWRNPDTGVPRVIYIVGFNPAAPVLLLPEVNRVAARLLEPDVVLFDRLSRPEFGTISARVANLASVDISLMDDHRAVDPLLRVEGLFSLGPTFVIDGTIVTSDLNFEQLTHVSLDRVSFGLVKLAPGSDARRVQASLAARLGPDIRVFSKSALIDYEKSYWADHTSIGFVFDLGLLIGFVVGVVFSYQVLYGLINENMREYAVLVSLGHTRGFLRTIVLIAATTMGLVALAPASIASALVIAEARQSTGLDIVLTPAQISAVALCAAMMCLLAALIAVRRLRRADPADLFG